MLKFVEIESIEIINNVEMVNDLTVETNHNYIANDYIVHNCITSTNTGVNYPIASLIEDIIKAKDSLLCGCPNTHCPLIVADGGIRNYCDVIKALALGADYVMIGGLFGTKIESSLKCMVLGHYEGASTQIEECDTRQLMSQEGFVYDGNGDFYIDGNKKIMIVKAFYGMASKQGQQDMGVDEKVEEGISRNVAVDGTVEDWSKKMTHYLCSAMSYLNCYDVKDIYHQSRIIVVSPNAYNCINKIK